MSMPPFPGTVPEDDVPPPAVMVNYKSYAEEAAERAAQRDLAKTAKLANKTRMQMLIDGDISVDDLDDEELKRGQIKDSLGRFNKPPEMIPRVMYDAITRRILSRGAELMRQDFFTAINALTSIAGNEFAEDKNRIKAASIIIDRVAGRAPEKVELSVEVKPYEHLLVSGIYTPEDEMLEVEEVDDDPDED